MPKEPLCLAIRSTRALPALRLACLFPGHPGHVHDSQVGWFVVLVAAFLYGFQVLVVYADAGYDNWRMFKVIHDILGAHPAVNYNFAAR